MHTVNEINNKNKNKNEAAEIITDLLLATLLSAWLTNRFDAIALGLPVQNQSFSVLFHGRRWRS